MSEDFTWTVAESELKKRLEKKRAKINQKHEGIRKEAKERREDRQKFLAERAEAYRKKALKNVEGVKPTTQETLI